MNGKMIGDILREARLSKQLQLTDIESRTGIEVHHLLALELDQFSLVPAEEVELYLRSYAELVNLDAEEILIQYANQNSFLNTLPHSRVAKTKSELVSISLDKEDVPMERMAHRRRRSHREATQKKSVFPKVLLSLLSISAIALIGYFAVKHWPLTDFIKQAGNETPSTTEETTVTTVVETTTVTEMPIVLKAEVQEDGSYLATLKTDKEVSDVTFTLKEGESWVSLNDGVNGEQGMLLTPDQNTFTLSVNKGTSPFITVGQPTQTTITADGQEIDLSELVNSVPATFTLKVE